MLTHPQILPGTPWRTFPDHSWWCWLNLQRCCVLCWHRMVQDLPRGNWTSHRRSQWGPITCRMELLPSPVGRLRSDSQQSWAGPDRVVVQMVKWECFSHFCESFEEFVNYFLACCFGREISSRWQQVCKRNQKSGQPQYFIFDSVFLRYCLLLQKARNQSTCRIKAFLMNRKEEKFLLSSVSYKRLKLSGKKH